MVCPFCHEEDKCSFVRSLQGTPALVIINSAVLGIILNNVEVGYSFIRSTVFSIFGGVGFGIAMILMAGVREKIKYNDIPGPFEGVPILLVTAGLMSIAFYGFTGLLL
ncbi:MAG: hypothetical protein IKD64_05940 [Lachnospiraceae bacterium]|nr:hypothetical protein [Lachnospiraceae bacterium]